MPPPQGLAALAEKVQLAIVGEDFRLYMPLLLPPVTVKPSKIAALASSLPLTT